jgi:hypothetical protein
MRDKDGGDDTEVKRPQSLEKQGVTEVEVLPHERWHKLGSLIQGVVVRRGLKGMWKLRSPQADWQAEIRVKRSSGGVS